MGNLGPAPEAYSLYEWSRVTGYLGMYADAEKGFNDVLILIDKAGEKAKDLRAPALGELARLLHDTDTAHVEFTGNSVFETKEIGKNPVYTRQFERDINHCAA